MITLPPNDAFNKTLLQNTHPANWNNPTPDGTYNLVAIGGGTAGLVAAAGASGLGAKVALIEKKLLGGDCLNFGCVPSKALLKSAHMAFSQKHLEQFGLQNNTSASPDFARVMERVRSLRADISSHDSAARFTNLGVDVFLGQCRFTSNNTLEVDGQEIKFKKAVIATGARASIPPIPGADSVDVLTNENVFNLTSLPKEMVIIGGGPIACEMAQAFNRLGSQVTMLVVEDVILPKEDPDLGKIIQNQFEAEGICVRNNISIASVQQKAGQKEVQFTQASLQKSVYCDALFMATGRSPNVENLGLEAAGVTFGKLGIKVNDYLQTSSRNIYAAGDVCSAFQFTHAADAMARIVIQNALFFGKKKVSDLVIPWATYTVPEIAHIGINTTEANRNIKIATLEVQMKEIDRAILESETQGLARVHYEKKSGKILGCSIISEHAGELISEISLAMTNKLTLGNLAKTIHPYPTQTEILKKLGDAYNRTKLTPKVYRLMKHFLAWRR